MAATKDSVPSRLSNGLNPTPSSSSNALPIKSPQHARHPSGGSALASQHRITRRKSMSSSGANIAAVTQAIKQAAEANGFGASGVAASLPKLHGKAETTCLPAYPSPPSSLPNAGGLSAGLNSAPYAGKSTTLLNGSAIVDGHAPEVKPTPRNRRASEGTGSGPALSQKGIRVRSGSELKCDKCGKGYKHSSCLTKHLWEHTPEWQFTSKLLISKHQQVQLLEAASILVSMNPTPPASSSGASNNDANSSANSSSDETTPPPAAMLGSSLTSPVPTPRGIRTIPGKAGKRYSTSNSYSRSFTASNNFLTGVSAPTAPAFPNHLPPRPAPRPRAGSSSISAARSPMIRPTASNEDDALAAAVELLSCSFHASGSVPRSGAMEAGSPMLSASMLGRSYMEPVKEEMKTEEDEMDVDMDSEDQAWRERQRSDEDEEGVFGRMEE
ncbi:hypothetical protein EX30DRAFT_231710 [Ascodesmis nigricans]|uniref:C2H2-type domain-containing protein n=1 Tax=Ascodesmis nigricans TaxID=341454 RepID=A0A4S2MIM7_9PEZI|nr:hypothetical protein EX30DRAFT_231710 [Ascodesmis nigricans]